LKWECFKCGECCRKLDVLITDNEKKRIENYLLRNDRKKDKKKFRKRLSKYSGQHGHVRDVMDDSYWFIIHPCPLLTKDNKCSVYPVRTYNCRVWNCWRKSLSEPFPTAERLVEETRGNPEVTRRVLNSIIGMDSKQSEIKAEKNEIQCPYFRECDHKKGLCFSVDHWKCRLFEQIAVRKIKLQHPEVV